MNWVRKLSGRGPGIWRFCALALCAILLMGQAGVGGLTSSSLRVTASDDEGDKVVVRVGTEDVFKISSDGTNTSIAITPVGSGTVSITDVVLNGNQSFADLNLTGALSAAGTITFSNVASGFDSAGVLKNTASGVLSSSLIGNADIDSGAAIAYGKLNLANSIQAGDLTDNAVTTAKIAASAVTNEKLATGAVATDNIQNIAITPEKVANGSYGIDITGSAGSFTGSLNGEVTGTQGATLVNAVSTDTANAIVRRDNSGDFSAGTITANLTGTASTATTALGLNAAAWASPGAIGATSPNTGAFTTISGVAPSATPSTVYSAHSLEASLTNATATSRALFTKMDATGSSSGAGANEVTGAWLEAVSDGGQTQGVFGQAWFTGGSLGSGLNWAVGLDGRARTNNGTGILAIGVSGRADDDNAGGSNVGVHAWAVNVAATGASAGLLAFGDADLTDQQDFQATLGSTFASAAVLAHNPNSDPDNYGLYIGAKNNVIDGDLIVTGRFMAGAPQWVKTTVTAASFTTETIALGAALPAGAVVHAVKLHVATAFDSGVTISVGDGTNDGSLLGPTAADSIGALATNGTIATWSQSSATQLTVTSSAPNPSVGEAEIWVLVSVTE